MGTQLGDLHAAGQSIWLDNIRRSMFASGELRRLVAAGLRGMTSNPTIFEKAIGSGNDYDAQLASLVSTEHDPNELFEALAIDDIRHACDEFRALFEETSGGDGFVSLEVSPLLAADTAGTVAAAKRLWAMVDRPNLMIKIPATPECISAISEVIAAGINVNVTLIFSLETYAEVADAYIVGLERRVAANEPIDRIGSVASIFVSRIDTAVDKLLDEAIAKGRTTLGALKGKVAIANCALIYERYREIFESARFATIKDRGARVQRPLWASTGTKNPAYPDLMYVENLVGKNTVNTVPPATLDALVEHGRIEPDTVTRELDAAKKIIADLAGAQISLFDVTQKLQREGVRSFAQSYNAMLAAIGSKQRVLAGGGERVEIALGSTQVDVAGAVARLATDEFLTKLWKHDPTPWTNDPTAAAIVRNALGWLDFPRTVFDHVEELGAFATDCAKRFGDVVVLGMGGSSLAPDVLRSTFGKIAGFPTLHVLDSSDPAAIATLERSLDLERTLFIVASKSGTTTEPEAFFRYFYERVQKIVGADAAGKQFIAITDPGTALGTEAKDAGFLRIFENDAEIGGRYSALSYFGMVPAALAGYDVRTILDRGLGVLTANSRTSDVFDARGVRFGATIGTLARAGRDKLTIIAHPEVAAFGAWAEQLVAESTGKNGTGIIPIEGEPLGLPADYGNDRVFVYVGAGLPPDEHLQGLMDGGAIETRLHMLEEAGHPVIRLRMSDRLDIGEQFAFWEIATATAGAILGINAFDQPNVQESKDNTKRLLAEFKSRGAFAAAQPAARTAVAEIYPLAGSSSLDLHGDFAAAIAAVVAQIRPDDYVAFTAYIEMNEAHRLALETIRLKVRDALKVATTVGFGPRFLHSTGQLHKGGPNSGVFFQITTDTAPPDDRAIPGMVTFATLLRAQALGDFESLDSRARRGVRVHFTVPLDSGLETFSGALDEAVAARR